MSSGCQRTGTRLVLVAVLLTVAGLTARMLLGARAELGHAARATDAEARVRHLRRAMAYYLPGNPWVGRAHDRLLALARRAESDGERDLALHAYRELRGAVLSLRGLGSPYGRTVDRIAPALAALTANTPGAARSLHGKDAIRNLASRLRDPPDPHPVWAFLGLCGFLLWVGAAMATIVVGLGPDLTPVWQRFWPLAGLVLLGLGLFATGMALA